MPGPGISNGYESLTVDNTSGGVALASVATNADHARLTLETAQIRFRVDGTAPTSSEGHLLEVGDVLALEGKGELQKFRAIRTGGTSGVLKVTYGVY